MGMGARWGLAVALVVAFAGNGRAVLTSGQLMTNFASATYSLPSGAAGQDSDPGVNGLNVGNSASAWVIATDSPQLCMSIFKYPSDNFGAPQVAGNYPGDFVCFTIGFSNCGGYTASNVTIVDVVPGNTVKAPAFPFASYVVGGSITLSSWWATDSAGPWQGTTPAGQIGPLYLRWIIGRIGYHKSGYLRYCVTIQ